jgi:hypothetical protein
MGHECRGRDVAEGLHAQLDVVDRLELLALGLMSVHVWKAKYRDFIAKSDDYRSI